MTETTVDTTNKPSRTPLIIMLVVALLPMLGAYLVYFTGIFMPSTTVNAGVFISPASSLEPLVSEEEWSDIQSNKKWRILIPVSQPCSDDCAQNLYTSRQVHIRLDQKSKRLERIALLPSSFSETEIQTLKNEHPRLKISATTIEQASNWLSQLALPEGLAKDYYLLVDQEGRAMMAYDNTQHGNDVLKDLKRAIKFSIDYQ